MSKKSKTNRRQVVKKSANSSKQAVRVNNQNNIKILKWTANPYCITGFGNAERDLLKGLYRKYPGIYNIFQMAINYHGEFYNEEEITGGIKNGRFQMCQAAGQRPPGVAISHHLFGQARFVQLVKEINFDFDMIFLAEDPFWLGGVIPTDPEGNQRVFVDAIRAALAAKGRPHVPIVGYFPIDGVPEQFWINNLNKYDVPVTYLPFGAKACIEKLPEISNKIKVIPLGLNNEEFYVLPQEEVKTYKRAVFGENNKDKYVILNCNRNQLRKNLPACLIAFSEFVKKYPDSIIYFHMKDVEQVGWNLPKIAGNLGLEVGKNVFFPANFQVTRGVPVQDLNKIFNVADMLITTAVGGGWELSLTQAFATDTLVVAPDNTSHSDLCSGGRALLYSSGERLSHKAFFRGDNEVMRPLPNIDEMLEKMIWARENPDKVKQIKNNALTWVNENILWENLTPVWHNLFTAVKNLKVQREQQIIQNHVKSKLNESLRTAPNPSYKQGQEASISFEKS